MSSMGEVLSLPVNQKTKKQKREGERTNNLKSVLHEQLSDSQTVGAKNPYDITLQSIIKQG